MDIDAVGVASCTAASRDIWPEGIRSRQCRSPRPEGVEVDDVLDIFLANVRYPEKALRGDLMAQLKE